MKTYLFECSKQEEVNGERKYPDYITVKVRKSDALRFLHEIVNDFYNNEDVTYFDMCGKLTETEE